MNRWNALSLRMTALVLVVAACVACAKKQVCQCAANVGGTPPTNQEEESARSRALQECLERHGGGTIAGCPMPPSAPPSR